MKCILFCLTLYYVILTNLLLFATKRYLRMDYLFLSIIFFLYLITIILAIFGILNDLNIIVIDHNTTNYLNELDFLVEIPEVQCIADGEVLNKDKSVFFKFLNLFSDNHNGRCLNIVELKNSYYINNIKTIGYHNNIEWLDICKKYTYITAQNKEILLIIDCFSDILEDLESIKNDLSKAK